MSKSEFRWNKKRKHYSYLFKNVGSKCMNLLISTKPYVYRKGRVVIRNIPLFKHPNPNKKGQFYLVPRRYLDDYSCFEEKVYDTWRFDINDKRLVKRIKKITEKKKAGS